ncbi:hypothetical protein E4U32_007278 [Claviceps aff. humidiphila group G2b]|nr:hypothetical protein E4U32_007278 [Claviceps aff. humidiphila group G2b]
MAEVWARDILSTFDVHDGAADFLLDVLRSSLTPAEEVQSLVEASMFADSDKFHDLFGCRLRDPNGNRHEGSDILTFVWQLLAERDDKSDIQSAPEEQNGAREEHKDNVALSVLDGRCSEPAMRMHLIVTPQALQRTSAAIIVVTVFCAGHPQRKPAGTVPSVPFPPLSSLHFGLIQEKMAHDPFWLLVAVTFLIKTNGQVSIPVFYKVKQRFPSPTELADPRNAQELLSMIRHLGLATNRLKQIQKYASRFLEAPPTAGILHRVRNYDARDDPPESGDASCVNPDASLMPDTSAGKASRNSWEIGHMTQGRYTLDRLEDILPGRSSRTSPRLEGQRTRSRHEFPA